MNIQGVTEVAGTVGATAATLALANAAGGGMSELMPLVVPAVSAAVGMVAGYAVLRSTVQQIKDDLKETKMDMKQLLHELNVKSVAVAKLETRVDALER
jgi:hypothetical protein